jgi:hypothetical protein
MSHFSGHFDPLKMSLEMAHKVIVPQKKIMSRSFLNSGTLIVSISIGLVSGIAVQQKIPFIIRYCSTTEFLLLLFQYSFIQYI